MTRLLQKDDLWEVRRFARATIDALSTQICVLDATGTILVVNHAWRNFALANSPVRHNVNEGANYLAICAAATGPCSEEAAPFAEGIRAVLSGKTVEFSLEYPWHSGDEQRWFNGRVTRLPDVDACLAVVAHENITDRKLAELALQEAKGELERQVERRTAKVALTKQQLMRSVERLSVLGAQLHLAEERERRRIARDLHDQVVQNLALATIKLEMALKRQALPAGEEVENLQRILEISMKDLRNLCIDLSPPILYDLGLKAAISSLGTRLAKEYDFAFALKGGPQEPRLGEETRIALFQMARELLTNAVKHAGAGLITAELGQDGELVRLVVADDGVGFVPSDDRAGFGLANLRQRVDYLRGTFCVVSAPGKGTRVEITIPSRLAGQGEKN